MIYPLPPGEEQHSNVADSFGCVSFSAVHCIESQEIQQTGSTIGYSERALAKLSGTVYNNPKPEKNGNSVQNVYNTILEYGLIPDSLWPTDLDGGMWTLEEFYADIPQDVLNQAIKPQISLVAGCNYSLSPVWTQLRIGGTENHMVEGLNQTQYFDSYETYLKNYTPDDVVVWQGNLILNPLSKRMLVFFQVKGTATIWALMDGQWVGFSDMVAFNNYVAGRPYVSVNLDQVEFARLKSNPDVFKS